MKLVCVFLVFFSLQCIESVPTCPSDKIWCGAVCLWCCGDWNCGPGESCTMVGCAGGDGAIGGVNIEKDKKTKRPLKLDFQ
eukprot:14812.XXX_727082_726785_1 [CDS] Oithona nana genome sequencing.